MTLYTVKLIYRATESVTVEAESRDDALALAYERADLSDVIGHVVTDAETGREIAFGARA